MKNSSRPNSTGTRSKLINLLLTLVVLSFSNALVNAQIVNIPDANFKSYLVGNSSINTNLDSEIQVSEATAFTGTVSLQLNVDNFPDC
ncbi:MAG: hypothetical protein IH948_02875 [Bacteroidetes bacterium]|nr:hypothetical protein [Bacteroidota bacterium]